MAIFQVLAEDMPRSWRNVRTQFLARLRASRLGCSTFLMG